VKLEFLGAAGQVTGSQYLLHVDGVHVLVDCGMFQERAYLDRNWEPSIVPPKQIDALLLTHAHVDHCGLVPKLVQEGFRGPIYATAATADLVAVVLRDAAKIQMEDAAFKQKRHRKEGRSGRYPVKPLFTEDDVYHTLPLLRPVRYLEPVPIARSVTAKFCDAGHILGSAMLEINATPDGQPRRLVFSGDVGQWDRPIVRDPSVFTEADYVVMESTYGNRRHDNDEDVPEQLARVVRETVERGGNVIIPTFAIERAQELIYHFGSLLSDGRIPDVPIYLDSPMATEVTEVFRRHREDFDADAWQRIAAGESLLRVPGLRMVTSTEDSKAINQLTRPAIIMSTSGMCTAGRVKHHLVHNLKRPECTVLFVGYQAPGTLGRQILDGNEEVRIHGRLLPVRAAVEQIQGFSGHADAPTLLRWLSHFEKPPRQVFLTHGERDASLALAEQIRAQAGWTATVPEYRQSVELT
jgi:metallo-beta-lactamase family protein